MIRWRQPRDDNGIVRLVKTQLVPLSPWQHPRDSRLHTQITQRIRKGATLVVAQSRRSEPIGFLHMEFRYKTLFIDLLAVDSRYQNMHWGTELMARAEQYGRKKGCMMSHVFVDDNNDRALRFYHRLGYRTVRVIPDLKVIELAKPLFDA
ncbi:GNAT family N-acetyltransferase [Cohnella luojiensis]|uniref:GNAT family N-acetyltransferase n=1 Tax=Cohnella luojiensis TaxID=652876 RepID=A0A4Y8M271_9BACL|nr:GNAT family N-acetyltransferase [Cohnella luojiensis]TFE28139.1 GNAT family N-acetyltransferase [Cohnella luojiensis]